MKKLIITSLLALTSAAFAAGTPAGTSISNVGLFEFTDTNGATTGQSTTPVNITVAQVYQPSVTPNGTVAAPGQTATARPGETATLIYDVTNLSNGTDTLSLSITDAVTGAPINGVIYLDNNNNGIVDAGDTPTATLSNMTADETRHVLVQYVVPAGSTGASSTYINLTATSATNPAAVDNNNVGQITAVNIVRFTLEEDRTVTTTPGAAVTATHTLTNTGNTPIVAADLRSSTTLVTSAAVTVTYTVTNSATGTTVSNPVLQTALQSAGNLPAGASYTIVVSYTPSTSAQNGAQFSNTLTVYSVTPDSTGTDNQVESTQAVTDTDTVNVNRGVASVSKVADNCGTSATCADTVVVNTPSAKPGDYVRYTVSVTNTGAAGMKFPTLRDYVPANTEFVSVTGTTTQAGTQVLFSADRTNWNTLAPTTLATTTNPANGPFVYVGLDRTADNDTTVDAGDELAPGQTLNLVLIVRVR